MLLLDIFTLFLAIHWSLISVYVILGWSAFLLYKVKQSGKRATYVELVIVSKASSSVKESLFECLQYHVTTFGCDMTVNIVIDEGCDLEEEVSQWVKSRLGCQLVIVPNEFQCEAIAKGRAIEYFIRHHVDSRKWYAFIDDDNKLLTDDFLYEVPYYEKKGYVCANGILKPRMGRSHITYIADHLRWFDDLSLFRFGTGLLGYAINGIHGELLLCQGDVLKRVSFNRETITEDFAFARELIKQGYRFWQSKTVISILSPHSFLDFIKQRSRWYKGLAQDVRSADRKTMLFSGIRIVIWKLSILGSWLLFPIWWFLIDLPLFVKLFCLIGALHYYLAYFTGVVRLKLHWSRKGWFLLLLPLYSIMEAIPPHYFSKSKGFFVIDKS
jgi:beta-1,4-mannosyltransferase